MCLRHPPQPLQPVQHVPLASACSSGSDSSCMCAGVKRFYKKADVKRVAKTVKREAHAKERRSELEPDLCGPLLCACAAEVLDGMLHVSNIEEGATPDENETLKREARAKERRSKLEPDLCVPPLL